MSHEAVSKAPDEPSYLFFRTGVRASDLVDSSQFPPQFQYTVTGKVRKRGSHGQLGTLVRVNEVDISIFRFRKLLYAIENKCSHAGGSLCSGDIEDIDGQPCVSCPRHGYCFDLLSGKSVAPEGHRQTVYPLRIEPDGELSVGFEELTTAAFSGEVDF